MGYFATHFYSDCKIRPIEEDESFQGFSDEWLNNHTATTKNGSLVVGIFREVKDNFANWRHYIDIHVLPEMCKTIRKAISEDKNVTYFCEDGLLEESYIKRILKMKFVSKIDFEKLDNKIVSKIREVEDYRNIAIITASTSCVFALKYLIERINTCQHITISAPIVIS
jgi:hypothetical protein